jgi:putative ABC transport system permease protein
MFKNYLKIALPSVQAQSVFFRQYSRLGGRFGVLPVDQLVRQDELSYDRYHAKADRIFKVVMDSRNPEKEAKFALTPAGRNDGAGFSRSRNRHAALHFFGNAVVTYGEKRINERSIFRRFDIL